ncbi:Glycosyltransferase involved in cell wall bisynthesis [Poseidonocella pacifica]|uniref:Glycosyltransferase involved in cell wall bisynthesis n=1 Tax=Poseidonocella pacifica TaxID=871651 RepID=A0A1I0X4P4_9RHOB|nr:glycosyltransferase [Poseidonocella pacifica]SFA96012.1 Glycosyltransferase involved in cell wall bisynthesis [Poseidonocella pacifica]
MRIAVVAHLRHPIAPPFPGGIEAHTWHLCRGLRARGHDVTLFASGDSDAGVPLRSLLRKHYEIRYPWHRYRATPELTAVLDEAYAGALAELSGGGFDVVHNNSLHRFIPRLARRDRIPMVTALHVPPFDVLSRAVASGIAPWSRMTVCSTAHGRSWWPLALPDSASVVRNGIDLEAWPFAPAPGHGAVWAGRLTETKGPHLAIEAARIAGVPLTLYGPLEDRRYFDTEIAPRLGGGISYGGHLQGAALAEAFGRAALCVFTPLWDEPFGLVAAEAMACGLPIAATDMGAAGEVIGDAGSLAPAGDAAALAKAIQDAAEIPRDIPRHRVERFFSIERMLDGYEAAYRQAIAAQDTPAPNVEFAPHELPPRAFAIAAAE